ncbi:MAG: nucleotidyltransferase domain-containing protein [Pseudolabrys sp.]|nr:nucleotidyltransferase domain-containing protein [Pseudolabrys sp.]
MLDVLTGAQRRQLIDTQQVFATWRAAKSDRERRFSGGMRWAKRGKTEYLLRKTGKRETSIGVRSAELELIYDAFITGRAENRDRLHNLKERLDAIAPVNLAMGIGRVPRIAADILRSCDDAGLLGQQLFVVGTNALFAYEALAGTFVASDLVASGDIDLLFDARQRLSVAVIDLRQAGLIGLLQKTDRSFAPFRPRRYRAANRDGYMVDLIRPEPRDVFRDKLPAGLTNLPDDMEGAPIFGLAWLVNTQKVETVAIDERGYPVRIVAIDPRAFALHKAWVSRRPDREPLKAHRDLEQAKAAADIAVRYLRLPFDTQVLDALPSALRRMAPELTGSNAKAR